MPRAQAQPQWVSQIGPPEERGLCVIIDGDSHLYEPRRMWHDYCDPADRDVAIRIENDELGYAWLTVRGQSIGKRAYISSPTAGADFSGLGKALHRWRDGLPNEETHYDQMPATYWDPGARRDILATWGIDHSVLFPQFGFQWEWPLASDPYALRVNMEAWNRYAAEVAEEGRGKLHPVGHVNLDSDPRWLRQQLEFLSKNNIRMAMCYPSLVDGRRLSHPDLDGMWRAFTDSDVAVAWHVTSQMATVFDNYQAWGDNDNGMVRFVTGLHLKAAAELALTDMAGNGVFQRHPRLRVVTAELGAEWFSSLCRRADSWMKIHDELDGRPLNPELAEPPSEYLRRAVTLVCSFPTDWSPQIMTELADNAAYGGDYPHPEGLNDPLREYQEQVGELDPSVADRIYGANLARILHLGQSQAA
jgi:predicted TIM-barrel fold metal-dependent hydrolase